VKLLKIDTGTGMFKLFLACPIPPDETLEKVVERTVDSSRLEN
jgi:hypothetical protein